MNATKKKKITSEIMGILAKHFNLGLRYPSDKFKMEDVPWLAEHQKEDVERIMKILEKADERV